MTTPRRSVCVLLAFMASIAFACSRDAQAFDDLPTLAEAVSEAGVPCDRVEEGPEAQLVVASGKCARSSVTLYLFDSADKLEDWKKVGSRIGPAVIGPNWTATGDRAELESIAEELGGELSNP